jgi:anti-sigma factor RsiW
MTSASPTDSERLHLDLQAYFDAQMDAADRERFESELERNPDLRRELDEMRVLRSVVVEGLDAEARDVPAARFEQIWDQIDASIDRESRLQTSAGTRPSLWARVLPFLRPVAFPAAAVAVAAAFVVIVVSSTEDPSNSAPATASKEAVQAPSPATDSAPGVDAEPSRMARADETAPEPIRFEAPDSNEAEVERIEFGGHSGHIEQLEGTRGTTTVIWIEEDDQPADSERSL